MFWFAIHGFVMQISYRYQSADLEIDDWRMWRHEWFSLVIALKICIISRSAKRAIKMVFIPLYVSLITWKWKSNYFYSILEVFHKVLWKIKNRVICPLRIPLYNILYVDETFSIGTLWRQWLLYIIDVRLPGTLMNEEQDYVKWNEYLL